MLSDAQLRTLLDRYERPLVRYAQNILGDLESARDVVQDTFIKWVEGQDNDGSPSLLESEERHTEAWLFTVCRNRAIDYQRKQRRIVPMNPLEPERLSEEPIPGAALESEELALSLGLLLEELSENQREVIRLKFQNDLSYKEIAEITRLTVTNVGFLLHAGLKRLRSLLSEQPHVTFDFPFRKTL